MNNMLIDVAFIVICVQLVPSSALLCFLLYIFRLLHGYINHVFRIYKTLQLRNLTLSTLINHHFSNFLRICVRCCGMRKLKDKLFVVVDRSPGAARSLLPGLQEVFCWEFKPPFKETTLGNMI